MGLYRTVLTEDTLEDLRRFPHPEPLTGLRPVPRIPAGPSMRDMWGRRPLPQPRERATA